ncbi:MAG: epoxyqueuosine reductase QueH [Sphaerochaetaceae bacterium]
MASVSLLLHCCCGPCSTSSIERLIALGYEITLSFSNSNIWPQEEFEKRFEQLEKVAKTFNLPLFKSPYEHQRWLDYIAGYETEKEGGSRCALCFEYNLKEAALIAKKRGIAHFTTTLSVSPHKNSLRIFSVGSSWDEFVPIDFKKQGGFQRSIELAKEMELYRQSYCGCEFSLKQQKRNSHDRHTT